MLGDVDLRFLVSHGPHATRQRRVFGLRSSESAHRNAPTSEAVSPQGVEGLVHAGVSPRARRRIALVARAPAPPRGSSARSCDERRHGPLAVEPRRSARPRAAARRGWTGRSRGTGSAGPRAPPSRVRSQVASTFATNAAGRRSRPGSARSSPPPQPASAARSRTGAMRRGTVVRPTLRPPLRSVQQRLDRLARPARRAARSSSAVISTPTIRQPAASSASCARRRRSSQPSGTGNCAAITDGSSTSVSRWT